jgi:protein tyrosine phosphatase
MVWDQDVKLLVMLCQSESDTSNECTAYWEEQYQVSTKSKLHNIKVKQCAETEKSQIPVGMIRRILTITDGNTERTVEHLQIINWKDKKQPFEDTMPCLQFAVQRGLEIKKDPSNLICVHCSAGIGRTGTYIAILTMIESINY